MLRAHPSVRSAIAGLLLMTLCIAAPVFAQTAGSDLFELSLDELLSLSVTSVSKKSQPVSQTAAAVFVITNDDIRRSGVTTIPDALRLAPGVQVAKIDGNKWAISARGFNGQFANKLLVLIDGRTVYSPLFSGTFWDTQDTALGDIERIEVVRGPGATLWGSNAVNGVINIITRSAADSRGTRITAAVGNQERAILELRHGATLGDGGGYRFFGKFAERDGNELVADGRPSAGDWRKARLGFRADFAQDANNGYMLQGEVYTGYSGETSNDLSVAPPYISLVEQDQKVSGFHVLGRWEHSLGNGDELSLQSYLDRETRDWDYIDHERYSLDFDLDYRTRRFEGHDVVFGVDYRRLRDSASNTDRFALNPDSRRDKLLSAFIQDDIELSPERWLLTLGLKVERNDYTGVEYQPNLRLLWTPDAQRSVWTSVTRGVRIPGRADRDSLAFLQVLPPGETPSPLAIAVVTEGNPRFESEDVLSWELGFKYQATDALALDVAAYYNEYDDNRSTRFTPPACAPAGPFPACIGDPATTSIIVGNQQNNDLSVDAVGLEFAVDWRPAPRWRIQGSYAWREQEVSVDTPLANQAGFLFLDPRHLGSLRVSYDPRPDIEADLWLRQQSAADSFLADIDGFTAVDARLAWKPGKRSEWALVGRNLQDGAVYEYVAESGIVPPVAIRRSLHLQFSLEF